MVNLWGQVNGEFKLDRATQQNLISKGTKQQIRNIINLGDGGKSQDTKSTELGPKIYQRKNLLDFEVYMCFSFLIHSTTTNVWPMYIAHIQSAASFGCYCHPSFLTGTSIVTKCFPALLRRNFTCMKHITFANANNKHFFRLK